jgi:hypothetical protein
MIVELKGLIHERLASSAGLAEKLAGYAGRPAVFDTEFPSDQQAGWNGKNQYPRVCYRCDMQVNQERSSAGILHVSVYTNKDQSALDSLETLIRELLEGVLMKPSGRAPFCVAWAKTDVYVAQGLAVIFKEIDLDILEYPSQETTDPDPVLAVSAYIKNMYPGAVVLGIDRIGDYVNPADTPVFYCRLDNIQGTTGHCMNTISWFNARVAVHLICPDAAARLKMVAAISQQMARDTEIIMLDQSPMELKGIEVNNKADYLREGQLVVTGKYGCLRGGEKKHNISSIGISYTD